MKIEITVKEAMDRGVWEKICNLQGISPYALNEGLICDTEILVLKWEDAISIGLVNAEED